MKTLAFSLAVALGVAGAAYATLLPAVRPVAARVAPVAAVVNPFAVAQNPGPGWVEADWYTNGLTGGVRWLPADGTIDSTAEGNRFCEINNFDWRGMTSQSYIPAR